MEFRLQRPVHGNRRTLAIMLLTMLGHAAQTKAHEGPPFPILLDERTQDYVVSVWADPDIGEAKFFIIVESPSGGPPATTPQEFTMWAEPVSGRLDRVTYKTKRQTMRNQLQFEARPYFDRRDMWTVGFRVIGPNGRTNELTTKVESTPPGFGAWDLIIYLFPFALLAGMWALAMTRRKRARSEARTLASPAERSEALNDAETADARTTPKTAARPDPACTSKHAWE